MVDKRVNNDKIRTDDEDSLRYVIEGFGMKYTCHGCENLKHSNAGGNVPLAFCQATDDCFIIPHMADKDNITYTRVPTFCIAGDRMKSDKPAKKKYWETCDSISIIQRDCI